jgi:hypothetical protein
MRCKCGLAEKALMNVSECKTNVKSMFGCQEQIDLSGFVANELSAFGG